MSESAWRVLDGEGNEQGPYSSEDLQGFYSSGNIDHSTMVWTEGLDQWIPAGQVEGLLPAMPQVVELAAAQPAPTAPAPTTSGMDLTPQVPGVATSGELAKPSLPSWISLTTLLIGIAALVLFFLPWVSLAMNLSDSGEIKIGKSITQSGIQSITQDQSPTPEFIDAYAKNNGISVEEAEKAIDSEKEKSDEETSYKSSTLIMAAMIATGLGLILALIGITNRGRKLILIAQFIFILAALLIGIQMVKQFPMVASFVESMEFINEKATEIIEAEFEVNSLADPTAAAKKKAQNLQQLNDSSTVRSHFEPACLAAVGILSLSLLLIVVTMSSGGPPPIVIPQPGETNPQPGGIKFH